MSQTSRECVTAALSFTGPDRLPRQIWCLPGGREAWLASGLAERYPDDIMNAPSLALPSLREVGDPYSVGVSVDSWGVVWENAQAGHIGEVKAPLLRNLDDWREVVRPPDECLRLGGDLHRAQEMVNAFCARSDAFIIGSCCPRPWERYQFLRGSENAFCDLVEEPETVRLILNRIHDHYLRELEQWVHTEVDGICFLDDWGSQHGLLVDPLLWRALFKPMYRDYCDLAKANGKFVFMHSDGQIGAIYGDIVELGVNALNSQLFCMDLREIAATAKGRLCFHGEIDRQRVLPHPDPKVARDAVRKVARHLYDPAGGIIIQFEFGADTNPACAEAVFEEWEAIHSEMAAGQCPRSC